MVDLKLTINKLQEKPHGLNRNKKELCELSKDGQIGCYLGNWADFLAYMQKNNIKTMTSGRTLALLRANKQWWPGAFQVSPAVAYRSPAPDSRMGSVTKYVTSGLT
jgi:hypothetical protein